MVVEKAVKISTSLHLPHEVLVLDVREMIEVLHLDGFDEFHIPDDQEGFAKYEQTKHFFIFVLHIVLIDVVIEVFISQKHVVASKWEARLFKRYSKLLEVIKLLGDISVEEDEEDDATEDDF